MQKPPPTHADDADLPLRRAEDFEQFYAQTHLTVFRYLYGLIGGPREEVEDFTAETYSRAWKARRGFKGNRRAARGWLLCIARNLVIDAHRRQKTRGPEVALEQHDIRTEAPTPEEQVWLHQRTQTLWRLLQALPDRPREILVLRYLLGWRVNEIAAHLEISENNVSVSIRRALQRLRENWPEDES